MTFWYSAFKITKTIFLVKNKQCRQNVWFSIVGENQTFSVETWLKIMVKYFEKNENSSGAKNSNTGKSIGFSLNQNISPENK